MGCLSSKVGPEDFLKLVYDFEADRCIPGLSDQLKKNPRAYEVGFNYWLNCKLETLMEEALDAL